MTIERIPWAPWEDLLRPRAPQLFDEWRAMEQRAIDAWCYRLIPKSLRNHWAIGEPAIDLTAWANRRKLRRLPEPERSRFASTLRKREAFRRHGRRPFGFTIGGPRDGTPRYG